MKALMAANYGKYNIALDPLWNGEYEQEAEPFGKDEIAFYQCDHLGTPQELTDHEGKVAWSAQYKAWGEAKKAISDAARNAGMLNAVRFQGQYEDEETGLFYNRFRYYDPDTGRYLAQDPIRMAGGKNFYQYSPNSTGWIDPLGLNKKRKPSQNSQQTNNTSPPADGCTCECPGWTSHGGKHVANKNRPWSEIIEGTKSGAAKYKPGVDIQALEMAAWDTGTPARGSTVNRGYKVKSYDYVIGASEGKESRWLKIECSAGVVHGHPITEAEYRMRGGR
ncbi:RHS repeat domain-containing protein [Pseudoduganella armeniaca]|uniref:RHS repeat domain-containing protein n=1 Tax=Pseudoduganella armeniaca TaxID=2072590 RepID=UPI0015E7CB75|nr:RHS repeat-associated core domain-containing protein [Pseudoduganella armeniaca]